MACGYAELLMDAWAPIELRVVETNAFIFHAGRDLPEEHVRHREG